MSGLLLGTVGVRPALSFGFDVQRIPSEQSAPVGSYPETGFEEINGNLP